MEKNPDQNEMDPQHCQITNDLSSQVTTLKKCMNGRNWIYTFFL